MQKVVQFKWSRIAQINILSILMSSNDHYLCALQALKHFRTQSQIYFCKLKFQASSQQLNQQADAKNYPFGDVESNKFIFPLNIQFGYPSNNKQVLENMNQLFEQAIGVQVQVEKKKRKNHFNGMWGSDVTIPADLVDKLSYSTFLDSDSLFGMNLQGSGWLNQHVKRSGFQLLDSNNIKEFESEADFEDNQITFLEPSPIMNQLDQLEKQGKQFYDDRFPPTPATIDGIDEINDTWKKSKSCLPWKKMAQCIPGSKIFCGKIDPLSLVQGALGDCYLIASMSALAEVPDRVMKLFITKEVNAAKYFSVKLLYKGKWMRVDVDQNMPFELNGKNKPAFACTSNNGEMWASILQKAWAKLFKSYRRISGGLASETLHCLTGAPIKEINSTKQTPDFKNWEYLVMASKKKFAMVANSCGGKVMQEGTSIGIHKGHAYTFLHATPVNFAGKTEKLVQLRNPWGRDAYNQLGQYNGPWNDHDPQWNLVSQSQKDRLRYSKDKNDGIFFMPYELFRQYYSKVTVAEINDNASYVYKTMKDKQLGGVYFKVQILKPGYYSFQIDNTPRRNFAQFGIAGIGPTRYRCPQITFELGKINGNSCYKIARISEQSDVLYSGHQLQEGLYVVYSKIQFDMQNEQDFDINLAIYSEYASKVEMADRNQVVAFTGNASISWNPADHESKGTWNELGNEQFHGGHKKYVPTENSVTQNNNDGWGDYFYGQDMNTENGQSGNSGFGKKNSIEIDPWSNTQKKDDGWGQPTQPVQSNSNGWGQSDNTNSEWSSNGWGSSDNTNIGWGQPIQNKASNGWDQSTNSTNNGWGEQSHNQNNGWGQPTQSQSNNGWNQNRKLTSSDGWGEAPKVNWGQNTRSQEFSNDGWGSEPKTNQSNVNNGWGQSDGWGSTGQQASNNGWGTQNSSNNNGW